MKIATIIGARPQFIKAAGVSRAIAARNHRAPGVRRLTEIIVHTGQHYDNGMSAVFFKELEIPEPAYHLNVGSGPHGMQTGRMLAKIEEVLIKEAPDWVLVYGDTNSTLAGALAAAKLHIRIAHVEAGLRSFNRLMPEEINRVVADQLSDLLLCPSETAVANLAREGIDPDSSPLKPRICLCGDVMADALRFAASKATGHPDILSRLNLEPRGYLLATVHRAENTDDPERLGNIMAAFSELAERETVVLPLHPRTRKVLADRSALLPTGRSSLKIIDPVSYFDVVALEKSARLVLTDSGGMQKEAYWLKVPCVTLRDETEWVETVDAAWNVLAGADRERIVAAACTFKTPSRHLPLYGDGRSAEKIVEIISHLDVPTHVPFKRNTYDSKHPLSIG